MSLLHYLELTHLTRAFVISEAIEGVAKLSKRKAWRAKQGSDEDGRPRERRRIQLSHALH